MDYPPCRSLAGVLADTFQLARDHRGELAMAWRRPSCAEARYWAAIP